MRGFIGGAALIATGLWLTLGPAVAAPDKSAHLTAADRKFVLQAAKGGLEEVSFGKLAAEKGANEDVKKFGQRMVDDHSKANEELKQLASQKGVELPQEMDAKAKKQYEHLSALSGEQFDRTYMAMMVKDHQKDVAAFEKRSASAKDGDLKVWATDKVPVLQEHLKMARETASAVGAMGGTRSGGHKKKG